MNSSDKRKANANACRLCLSATADQTNSHIIPKFLCKGLFESTKPRHALLVDRFGGQKKVQDTPKEDYILCTYCERRIGVIEDLFSRVVESIHQYQKYPGKFKQLQLGTQVFLECQDLDPILFKVFLYSLVWRASISDLFEFQPFKLDTVCEEELRVFLDTVLNVKKQQLLTNLNEVSKFPKYHNCFVKPKVRSGNSRGVLSAVSMNAAAHILFLVDFVIFFYTDNKSIGDVLIHYSNKENAKVRIPLGDEDRWRELNQLYLSKMLHGK